MLGRVDKRLIIGFVVWASACGGGGGGGPGGAGGASGFSGSSGSSASSGSGGSGGSGGEVSPTRACVLNGTCQLCHDDDQCWEGFPFGSCPSSLDQPASATQTTCPALGFPVNCDGQNLFHRAGHECSGGSGGSGGGSGQVAFGEPCTSTSQCASGLRCMYYYGNPINGLRCLQPCQTHADCSGYTHPDFAAPFRACWNCTDGVVGPDPGEEQCLPLNVCGGTVGGGAACDNCLQTCSGLPSCCTGCGCICESECGAC